MQTKSVFIAALITTAAALAGAYAHYQSQKELSCLPHDVDFGDVAQLSVSSKDIRLINRSGEAIRIQSVATSCGCTQASLDADTVEPKGSIPLHVRFSGESYNGDVLRFIVLKLVDKTEINIPVKAHVFPYVSISRNALDFGNLRLGQTASQTIMLRSQKPTTHFHVTHVSADSELRVHTIEQSAEQTSLVVTSAPMKTSGERFDKLNITTDVPSIEDVEVSVHFNATGKYTVQKPQLLFDSVRITRTISTMINTGKRIPQITVLSCPHSVSAHVERQGGHVLLTATCTSDHSNRIMSGNIVLQTNDPIEQRITVPVTALLQ